ncbi:MAG: caspase family protein, partial [Gemmataceae bacterium]
MRRILAMVLLTSLAAGLASSQDGDDAPPGDGNAVLTIDNGGHVGPVTGLAFTPDGKTLITCGRDRTVQEWDAASGERTRVIRPPAYAAVPGDLNGVGLIGPPADKGASVVLAGGGIPGPGGKGRVHRLFLLDRSTGRIADLDLTGINPLFVVDALAASPAKARVACARGENVVVHAKINQAWEAKGRKPEYHFTEDGHRVRALAFSPDGMTLAAAGTKNGGVVSLYGMKAGKLVSRAETRDWGLCIAWEPSGAQLVTGHRAKAGGQPLLQAWTAAGKPGKSFARADVSRRLAGVSSDVYLMAAAFRKSGEVVAVCHWGEPGQPGAELVVALDLKTGRSRELFFRDGITTPHPGFDEAGVPLAISPDDKWAVTSTAPRATRIAWIDLAGKKETTFSGAAGQLRCPVGWHATEPEIAWTTLVNKTLNHALNLKTLEGRSGGKKQAQAFAAPFRGDVHEAGGWSAKHHDVLKDRHLVVTKGKKSVTTVQALRWIETFTVSAAKPAPWVAWSDRRSVWVSDAATGKTRSQGRPLRTRAYGLASSPDGKYLLAGTTRGLLHVYRVEGAGAAMLPLLTVYADGPEWVAWTAEGYYAATPGGEKRMGWAVSNGYDKAASFFPASRFRKTLYRPDLIARLLEAGSVQAALKATGQKAAKVEELLPPAVEIVSIKGDPAKGPVEVTVRAKARGDGQRILSLRLLLNGRPAGPPVELKGVKEVTRTIRLELPPGKHEVSALARSKDASGMSEEVRAARVGDRDARLASLFIGIDRYRNADLNLNAAVNDAKALGSAVQKYAGKPLYAKVDAPVQLHDAGATKRAILTAIEKLRTGGGRPLGSSDLAVISFAGHGFKKGDEFYLMPHEADDADAKATCISGAELKKALGGWPCQVVLLLDACHSGAGARALAAKYKPATDDAARELTDDDVSVVVLSAAMGHEKALEASGRGLFSRRLEEALAGKPGVGRNPSDKCVYLHHAFTHVFDNVKEDSDDKQHPFLSLPWTVESF